MIINNARIILPNREISRGSIVIEHQSIVAVNEEPVTADTEIIDAADLIAIPGLIDLHIHGVKGIDLTSSVTDGLLKMTQALPEFGITGFLGTTIAAPPAIMENIMVQAARLSADNSDSGAKCLGIYIEGSFINPEQRGSHPSQYIFPPDLELIRKWQTLAEGQIKIITLAPEITPPFFVEELINLDIIPAIGHSKANYEQTRLFLEKGAKYFTHLGNATGMPHQREPGLVGAALLDENSDIEIICDGIHLHPATVLSFIKQKGWDKIILVSDSTCFLGMPAGKYNWYQENVTLNGDILQLENGTIAGGVTSLHRAFQNIIDFTGCTLSAATRVTSLRPARILKLDHLYGSIARGKVADIVLLDKELNIRKTVINGKIVFEN